MALDFPTTDQSPFIAPNGVTYVHDGRKWVAADPASFLPITGGELTGDLIVPSLNSGQLAGFRNQIINGDFRVRQRGNNFNQLSGTNGYFADRWVGQGTDGTWNAALDTTNVPAGFSQSYTMTADAVRQFIELPGAGDRGIFTVGSTWTVSIWVDSANLDRCQFIFADSSTSRGNDVFVGNATFTSTGETSNGFTRFSGNLTLPATAPAGTNLCLMLNFVFTSKVNTTIAGAQLEPGPVATPFEHRPIGTELALCQRYYYQNTTANGVYTQQYDSENRMLQLWHPVEMRVVPTAVVTLEGGLSLTGPVFPDKRMWKGSVAAQPTDNTTYRTQSYTMNAEL